MEPQFAESQVLHRLWIFTILRGAGAVIVLVIWYSLTTGAQSNDELGQVSTPRDPELSLNSISLIGRSLPPSLISPTFEFDDPRFYLEFSLLVAFGALLASTIAYHPMVRIKMESVDEVEAPKTFLLYSIAGTIIGKLVSQQPIVALVIFGIGGLFRFRTDVGSAKETGGLLLVTLSGLCCGLGFPLLALVTVALVFALVWVLERKVTYRLRIDGIEETSIEAAATKSCELLRRLGCHVLRHRASPIKQQVELVFRAHLGFQELDFEDAWRHSRRDDRTSVLNWEKN